MLWLTLFFIHQGLVMLPNLFSELKMISYDRPSLFSVTILYRLTELIFYVVVALGFSGVMEGTFWCRGTTIVK